MAKFREFVTSRGLRVLGGKSDENNEELISQVGKGEIVLHTKSPGSPFVNIKGEPTKKDVLEAAVFCAKFSRDWRNNKSDVVVHVFNAEDIYKDPGMKKGTFGVKKFYEILVKAKDIKKFEKFLREKDEANKKTATWEKGIE